MDSLNLKQSMQKKFSTLAMHRKVNIFKLNSISRNNHKESK